MFRDRAEGGQKLGVALEKYRGTNAVVLGIPRGGVVTAYYVAKHLDAELHALVARKLGYPENPEAAFGAIAEDGSYFIFDECKDTLPEETIRQVVSNEREEINRRMAALRKGKSLPPLTGRTVILVDDGIATGATLFASLKMIEKQKPEMIVVAAPVSGARMIRLLKARVDEVVVLVVPEFYHAVSQVYEDFGNVEDETVTELLEQWENERLSHNHVK